MAAMRRCRAHRRHHGIVVGFRHRQPDGEGKGTAAAICRHHPHGAALQRHQHVANGQAQPRTAVLARGGGVHLRELLKQAEGTVCRDANPCVMHLHQQLYLHQWRRCRGGGGTCARRSRCVPPTALALALVPRRLTRCGCIAAPRRRARLIIKVVAGVSKPPPCRHAGVLLARHAVCLTLRHHRRFGRRRRQRVR